MPAFQRLAITWTFRFHRDWVLCCDNNRNRSTTFVRDYRVGWSKEKEEKVGNARAKGAPRKESANIGSMSGRNPHARVPLAIAHAHRNCNSNTRERERAKNKEKCRQESFIAFRRVPYAMFIIRWIQFETMVYTLENKIHILARMN